MEEPTRVTYPERCLLRLQEGTLDQIKEKAGGKGQTSAEYLRQVIRKALRSQPRAHDRAA